MNTEVTAPPIKLLELIKKTYGDFKLNWLEIAKNAWPWLAVTTVIDFVFSYPYPCSFPVIRAAYFNCADHTLVRLSAILIQLIIIISFICWLIKKFTNKQEHNKVKFLKKFSSILILFFIFILPVFSFWILFSRETNNHTLIELLIFFLVMIPFFGPFYVIRLILAPVLIEDNARFLGFIDSIKKTSHNFLNITLGFLGSLGITALYLLIPKYLLIVLIMHLGIIAILSITILFNAFLLAQIVLSTLYIINLKQVLASNP